MEDFVVDTNKPPIPPPLVTIRHNIFGARETRESIKLHKEWSYYIEKYGYELRKNDQETESPDPTAKQTIIIDPAKWDDNIIDCPFADQDGICLTAETEGMSVMYCQHCGLHDAPCLDKCPLEDGPVEVRLGTSVVEYEVDACEHGADCKWYPSSCDDCSGELFEKKEK